MIQSGSGLLNLYRKGLNGRAEPAGRRVGLGGAGPGWKRMGVWPEWEGLERRWESGGMERGEKARGGGK